jgi:hypothetical protein
MSYKYKAAGEGSEFQRKNMQKAATINIQLVSVMAKKGAPLPALT